MEFDSASRDWREPFGGRLYQSCLPDVRAIFENVKNPVRGPPARFVVLRPPNILVHGRLGRNILSADGTSANQERKELDHFAAKEISVCG